MLPASKCCSNCTSRKMFTEFKRQIAKTSMAAVTRKMNHHIKFKTPKLANQKHARSSSTTKVQIQAATNTPSFVGENRSEFMSFLPDIVRDLTNESPYPDASDAVKRYKEVLDHNVPSGKMFRGLSTVIAYKMLEKKENLTAENIKLANILGWCVELTETSFNMADDIVDCSDEREDRTAWHKMKNIGNRAVNDVTLSGCSSFLIIKKYFSDRRCYVPLLESFHDVTINTYMGQMFDNMFVKDGKPDLDMFTMEKYEALVKYKSAYFASQFPVTVAMCLAEIDEHQDYKQAKAILMGLGKLFTMQDDLLDSFVHSKEMGSDIANGKCTWCAVAALDKATPAQRKIMEEHYGRPELESVQKVKSLYQELDIASIFRKLEAENLNAMETQIQQIANGAYYNLFHTMLEPYGCLEVKVVN